MEPIPEDHTVVLITTDQTSDHESSIRYEQCKMVCYAMFVFAVLIGLVFILIFGLRESKL